MRKRGCKSLYVRRTHVGRGLFSRRRYKPFEVISEITGTVIADAEYGSEYCFEIGNGLILEPNPPIRFINHSCEPNCEFLVFAHRHVDGSPSPALVLLIAVEDTKPGMELTIDYNWTVAAAIPCRCRSQLCRGWIVAPDQISNVQSRSC